ncbi:MAG: beta-propeller fold lactonase family protein [bacterium]
MLAPRIRQTAREPLSSDPMGRILIAGNQSEDRVVVFRIDPETGALSPTGHEAEARRPGCVKCFRTPR